MPLDLTIFVRPRKKKRHALYNAAWLPDETIANVKNLKLLIPEAHRKDFICTKYPSPFENLESVSIHYLGRYSDANCYFALLKRYFASALKVYLECSLSCFDTGRIDKEMFSAWENLYHLRIDMGVFYLWPRQFWLFRRLAEFLPKGLRSLLVVGKYSGSPTEWDENLSDFEELVRSIVPNLTLMTSTLNVDDSNFSYNRTLKFGLVSDTHVPFSNEHLHLNASRDYKFRSIV